MPMDMTKELAGISRGGAGFARANAALGLVGFATFASLYCVQPLMPLFSREFAVTPAIASLTLSATTLALAFGVLVAGPISESLGRRSVMFASLLVAASCDIGGAFSHGFATLLVWRLLEGLALAGLPAVAMAYIGEEFQASSLGITMGLYVASTAIGGLAGRLAAGIIADGHGWRTALATIGCAGFAVALAFVRLLPPSRRFVSRAFRVTTMFGAYRDHFGDGGLRALYAIGFVSMGTFVSLYNYLSYRLLAAPYHLTQTALASVYVVYLGGIAASLGVGELADRFGRRRLLWLAFGTIFVGAIVTLASGLAPIVIGIAIVTLGFFATHSLASSWIGRRARHALAQASSLYLFFYYLGSTTLGTLGGIAYAARGWGGLVASLALLLVPGFLVALRLRGLVPVSSVSVPQRIVG